MENFWYLFIFTNKFEVFDDIWKGTKCLNKNEHFSKGKFEHGHLLGYHYKLCHMQLKCNKKNKLA